MADAVFTQVIDNPGWVVDGTGKLSPALGQVVKAVTDALGKAGDVRLSQQTAVDAVVAALGAVARQPHFLDNLPDGRTVIGAAVEAVARSAFGGDANATWMLAKREVLGSMVQIALGELSATGQPQVKLPQLEAFLTTTLQVEAAAGKPWSETTFSTALRAAL